MKPASLELDLCNTPRVEETGRRESVTLLGRRRHRPGESTTTSAGHTDLSAT